jgi:hypothetical protein
MSFWSSLGKGILGSIPVVGPIVGGIIQGAEESKTAKNAANQQVAATNQAIGLLKPYSDTGTKAFNTLGSLMGLGTSGGGGTMPAVQSSLGTTGQVTGPSASYLSANNMGAISDPSKQPDASYGANGQFVGNLSQSQRAQDPMSASSYGSGTPQMHGSSPMIPQVTMKAPDGSTQAVPADQVSYWRQKGAEVVS